MYSRPLQAYRKPAYFTMAGMKAPWEHAGFRLSLFRQACAYSLIDYLFLGYKKSFRKQMLLKAEELVREKEALASSKIEEMNNK